MTDARRSPDRRCNPIANDYLRDEPALVTSLDFGPFVAQGVGPGPSVLIGDQSEINLIGGVADTRLDHRMALLAQRGDIVLVRQREAGFESYLAECLGLDDVTFLQVDDRPALPVTQQVRTSTAQFNALVDAARGQGGLTLKAYLTTGNVWRLAQAVGEMSQQRIHVCGPSPRTTRRVNDKLWFGQLARKIIGTHATPPTLAAYGPAAAAGLVRHISRSAGQVIVKVPDSAGSAGNIRIERARLSGMSLADLRQFLLARLHAMGWQDRYPILVGVWDDKVSHSPSVQLWVPHVSQSDPLVEGVFEQRVQGDAAAFTGATQSALPVSMQNRLKAEAICIARVLQRLGYFGRCSFDAVICERSGASDIIHWIECNGRWGGVSIPMTAASRLLPAVVRPPIAIVQEVVPGPAMDAEALRRHLSDLLFRHDQGDSGLVILSPPERPNGMSVNLLAVAQTQGAADDLLIEAMRRLAPAG